MTINENGDEKRVLRIKSKISELAKLIDLLTEVINQIECQIIKIRKVVI